MTPEEKRQKNREKTARWRAKHPERQKESSLRYREKNREELRRREAERQRNMRANETPEEKEARRAAERARRKANPDREWKHIIKVRYGITPEQYEALLAEQGGRCAICGTEEPGRTGVRKWSVDHCHTTGRVRGILCHPCNLMLGKARDNPEILRKGADYLSR